MIATGRGWDLLGRACRVGGELADRAVDCAVDRLTPWFRRWMQKGREP